MAKSEGTSAVGPVLIGAGIIMLSGVLKDLFGGGDGGGTGPPNDQPGGDVDTNAGDNRPATISIAEATVLADAIETAIWGTTGWRPWDDEEAVVRAMTWPTIRVTNDVRILMNVYGVRGTFDGLNLPETIAAYLDHEWKLYIDQRYAERGITIQF